VNKEQWINGKKGMEKMIDYAKETGQRNIGTVKKKGKKNNNSKEKENQENQPRAMETRKEEDAHGI
jgi:hypothetical protein